ncbi:trypsin-like peptidase domain-containing protein [Candidatus Pacearchaeota archaeon]|nr:trypsin-like peptidase domain-containing protein [Candidatus Pacearchaeota archaeon]
MALIPPGFIDTVVAIGIDDAEGKRKWIASGFIFGKIKSRKSDGNALGKVYLITNRHVVKSQTKAYLRFNSKGKEPAKIFKIESKGKDGNIQFFTHPNSKIDVAVVPINYDILVKKGIQVDYFHSDKNIANIEKMIEEGITEGDFVYVLGFPMGLIGGQRNAVIVRSGVIARIQDTLDNSSNTFLVDAFVFPGNSGGPVILKPELISITGTKTHKTPYLLGIVQSYVPYKDVAISSQTNKPRIIFEENSGLAAIHPIDFIEETIQVHEKYVDELRAKGKIK